MIDGWDSARITKLREVIYSTFAHALQERPRDQHPPLIAAHRTFVEALTALDQILTTPDANSSSVYALCSAINAAAIAFERAVSRTEE